ncbi:MAG: cupin domain-containing protein [Phycisphaerales bacterium]|nr:cupin domain-containing protein [Phycisphaerales bacterium]
MNHTHIPDMTSLQDTPEKGILSRTIQNDENVKIVLFGFAAGEELSEHTASMPAIMHFLSGQADVTLGAEAIVATEGTWVHMDAGLKHSIKANSPVKMLLTLIKTGK